MATIPQPLKLVLLSGKIVRTQTILSRGSVPNEHTVLLPVSTRPAPYHPSMTDLHTLVETERAMQNRVAELGLDFEAAHAVSSIYRAANAVRGYVTTEVLRPVDISWTGFVVMWVVWIADGLETRRAAESAAISKATLTGVVKTLEARGWMEKVGREDDRRLVELHLTPSGKALMEDLYPKFNAIESRVVRGISPTRQKAMTKSLREIVTSIEASGSDGPAEQD